MLFLRAKSYSSTETKKDFINSADFVQTFTNSNKSDELLIKVSLFKTFHGFGFTIIGANEKNKDFLQIKHIVPDGAAAQDGRLRQGDVLVFVNEQCVLGYTHQDVVEIFKSIPIGNWIQLSVYRGHPLSIDLNDPNIKIMPLAAISNNSDRKVQLTRAPTVSFDSVNDVINNADYYEDEIFVSIVKGNNGFGFTIAEDSDSNYQKIKQIVNRERCFNLNENDVLTEINHMDLKGLSHNQVVDILKNCVCEQETVFKLKRKKLKNLKLSSTSSSNLQKHSASSTSRNGNENEIPISKGKPLTKIV